MDPNPTHPSLAPTRAGAPRPGGELGVRPRRGGERGGCDLLRPAAIQRAAAGGQFHRGRSAGADGLPPPARRAGLRDHEHAHLHRRTRSRRGPAARCSKPRAWMRIIVQDLGLVATGPRRSRRELRNPRLHADDASPRRKGCAFVDDALGLERAVLARELSLRELKKFGAPRRLRDVAPSTRAIPLEVFVHGALCVAYSGQCLTSESLGQRSANRGECAQACRMPYRTRRRWRDPRPRRPALPAFPAGSRRRR